MLKDQSFNHWYSSYPIQISLLFLLFLPPHSSSPYVMRLLSSSFTFFFSFLSLDSSDSFVPESFLLIFCLSTFSSSLIYFMQFLTNKCSPLSPFHLYFHSFSLQTTRAHPMPLLPIGKLVRFSLSRFGFCASHLLRLLTYVLNTL